MSGNIWFYLDDEDEDEDEDEDIYEENELDDIVIDEDDDDIEIICPECGAIVEDGLQCQLCGMFMEI